MAIVPDKHLDLFVQGSMIIFMEIYLFYQGLYSLMCVTFLFVYMASGYRKARVGSTACVIVLGDVGRSPRMQYHASSFAELGFNVDIIGYGGSKAHHDLVSNGLVRIHQMSDPPNLSVLPTILRYPLKVVYQALQLTWFMIIKIKWPSHVLVQNPPTIPTLAVAWVIGRIYGSKYMIDWHNYGYTILGLSLGKNHSLVKYAERFERLFCGRADDHLCVTNAMKEDLNTNWGLTNVTTLYDRAAEVFTETSLEKKHELFKRLGEENEVFKDRNGSQDETVFTKLVDGEIQMKEDRPALLISSTSWTEDEDFSTLLNALEKYEEAACENKNLPDIVCAITGKGPQKKYYEEIINHKAFAHVSICTLWLSAEDYPCLVGAADLGVCLHLSSSGLDLPMKVVDMFGCGLPVCAIHFNCLEELVKHGENGMVFHNQGELARQIQDLLRNFPEMKQLREFRENLKEFQELRWHESWMGTVKPLLYI